MDGQFLPRRKRATAPRRMSRVEDGSGTAKTRTLSMMKSVLEPVFVPVMSVNRMRRSALGAVKVKE